ncbi:MAG: TolB family protein [Myxococcota bacterium]
MLLLPLACAPAPQPELGGVMDRMPDAEAVAGDWTARVDAGRLSLAGPDGDFDLGADVLPGMAFAPDGGSLVFARHAADSPLADLWLVTLPPGEPRRLTDDPSFEDRPVFSPDGRKVAYFSGRSGFAALWVTDLATGETTQLTNVGLKRRPGHAPLGFVPPPEAGAPTWTDAIRWTAEGVPVEVRP